MEPRTRPALAQTVLDAVPYPTFGYTRDFRIAWANAAARSYFGLDDAALAELARGDGPRRREFRDRHFRAWARGDPPYPVRFRWDGATGKGDFLLIPFPTPALASAPFALVLIPRELLDAALGDQPVRAASHARKWMDLLAEAAARREPDVSRDERFAKLTPREWEIARRIALGDRVLLLAELLHISPNTVRNHLKSIFRKVGVHSQTQLVKTVRALAP
ncbi:MAG TPA: LuxR C-terminal-related transcriptional regulator [Myxococcota bacterium]|nr:LuxR C-terminal-related transcriptional regulator [Myxococcota bacterium]